MSDQIIADYNHVSSLRESYEEQVERGFQRRKRELAEYKAREAEERELVESRKREVHKVEAEAASANWYAALDGRINEHLKNWLWNAIDDRIREHIKIAQKPLVEATGDVFGRFRAQLRAEFRHGIEETVDAVGAKLAALEERLASNSWVDDRIKATLAHAHDEHKRVLEEQQRSFEAKLAALERRLKAVPGKLPVAKVWRPESVTYQAEFVCHKGALWQARKDTAQVPGGSDWICVARAGRDGQSVRVRGAFNATANYKRFDIVSLDGTAFIARRDNPGIPGISEDGWQLMSRAGTRGLAGEVGPRGRKGDKGERGEAAPTIVSWTLDRKNYRAVPTMSNGTQGAVLELRGLFEQYCEETSHAAE